MEVGFSLNEITKATQLGTFQEEKGEVEFTEELLEEHNFIVLYFNNTIDWLQAQTLFNLPRVKALHYQGKWGKAGTGLGRVIDGKKAIERIKNGD